MKYALPALACVAILMTLSCSQPSTDVAVPVPEVTEARARVLPNGMGVVYLSIRNPGRQVERLVSIESSAADTAETHESVDENGVMRMIAHPDGFEIPAGETLVLEPGGKHIMLMGPQVEEGAQTIPLVLHFDLADSIAIEAALMQMGGMDHGGMDHGEMDHGEMDHGEMDHGEMDHGEMDHGEMDHGEMDHGEMDHGNMDHGS